MKATMTSNYPRDLIGYGRNVPDAQWKNNAKVAVQFVLNYEEGGEQCILHGDSSSEIFLSEIVAAKEFHNQRHMSMESLYEYGSRVGVWRLLDLFKEYDIPITIFAVGMALMRHKELAHYFKQENYDVCAHGMRWISYQDIDIDTERQHMQECISTLQELLGKRPSGWYTGRNSPNTRQLVMEEGGFMYDSDAYDDDLPYWIMNGAKPHLVIPYTLDVNDMRFLTPQGFNTGEQFYTYLKDSFDALYKEGESKPKMMSIGMHARILGKPGRIMALRKFIDYVANKQGVWFCTRQQLAEHWYENHFPKTQ
jgi:putative urate catabolism protein